MISRGAQIFLIIQVINSRQQRSEIAAVAAELESRVIFGRYDLEHGWVPPQCGAMAYRWDTFPREESHSTSRWEDNRSESPGTFPAGIRAAFP